MPRGYVICMPHFAVQPLVYPYAIDVCRYCGGFIYISAWGSALLVSTTRAIPGASDCEASDSAGLHVFFMPTLLKSDYLIGGSEVLNRLKL